MGDETALVTANAYWKRPDAMTVDQPAQIALGIQSAPLAAQINERMREVPGVTQPAGPVQVSRHATATLVAASADVEVRPDKSQDNSTSPSGVDLYWIWIVTPKRPTSDLLWRPTDDLILTAYVVVHVDGIQNNDITTPITLRIPVKRTIPYTAKQIATSWKTYVAGIIGIPSIAGAIGWLRKRKRGEQDSAGDDEPRTQPEAAGSEADVDT